MGEYEGEPVKFAGVELLNLLKQCLKDSTNEKNFISKVAYGITDSTSDLKKSDEAKLAAWYKANKK